MKKKKILIIGCIAVVLIIGIAAFFTIPNRPDGTADIPELNEISYLTQEQLEQKIIGLRQEEIYRSWGKPDGHLSGFWGDIWSLNSESDKHITLYYDKDGIVEHIKVNDIH